MLNIFQLQKLFHLFFSSMRRDTVVEISSKGMIKTGLKSDICQVRPALGRALLFGCFINLSL